MLQALLPYILTKEHAVCFEVVGCKSLRYQCAMNSLQPLGSSQFSPPNLLKIPKAAIITGHHSPEFKYSSARETFPSKVNHLKCVKCPIIGLKQLKIPV